MTPSEQSDSAVQRAYAAGIFLDCPECGQRVLRADNGTWLDAEPAPDGDWFLIVVGNHCWAATGGGSDPNASRFHLHEHQDEDSCS
jgi:hypothetical protein